MPFKEPIEDEATMRELQEDDVLSADLVGKIMGDFNEFRLIDKLIEYEKDIDEVKWIAYLCRMPLFSYFGVQKPTPSFLKQLELSAGDKDTLMKFGAYPLLLEHDVLWLCGIRGSHDINALGQQIFTKIKYREIRFCAVPLSVIAEAKELMENI